MSTKNHSITEYVERMAELTNTNLEILKSLNDAFYTKSDHLTIEIGGETLTIPSFLSLESKITDLTESFNHLVDCPLNGQAEFNFGGNTQSIEMIGFNNEPGRLNILDTIPAGGLTNYESRFDDIFKDMVTPSVFVNFNLSSIPEHITEVLVKKVIIKNNELVKFLGLVENNSNIISYSDFAKIIYTYTLDKDYIEYDTRKILPVKNNDCFGTYKIKKIINNYVNSDFVQFYDVEIENKLVYTFNNNTIEYNLKVGDKLLSNDNKAKYTITNINSLKKILTIKVDTGFSEILDNSSSKQSTLKFYNDSFSDVKFKKLEVTLEEDQYIIIFIAPINSKINTRSQWSDGIAMDVFSLKDISGTSYNNYYKSNVKNIGDTLLNICQFTDVIVTNMNNSDVDMLTTTKPEISTNNLEVVQINKHLNDTKMLDGIAKLNVQKTQIKNDLSNCQNQIDSISTLLSSTNFSDSASTNRETYTNQLDKLFAKKRTLNKSYVTVVNEIKSSADTSVIPIEKSKFRIRGFFDTDSYINSLTGLNFDGLEAIKIEVEYRYKNTNKSSTTASTIGDTFLYSSWNRLTTIYRSRIAQWNSESDNENGKIVYLYESVGAAEDKPCFNQIDIPISQGEQVDIRLKVIYNAGYPFITMQSPWSDIKTITFPDELITDMNIYDMVKDNMEDIQDASFKNALIEAGIYDHADDKVIDQTITYFHKPEHVSSGFYTPERRIIPLSEKLKDIDTTLQSIKLDMGEDIEDVIKVVVSDGADSKVMRVGEDMNFLLDDYKSVVLTDSNTIGELKLAVQSLNIQISNDGRVPVKLWSLFPGDNVSSIEGYQTRSNPADFAAASIYSRAEPINTQRRSQYFYVRCKDEYVGGIYPVGSNQLPPDDGSAADIKTTGMYTYLDLSSIDSICVNGSAKNSRMIINPGEAKSFNITCEYYLEAIATDEDEDGNNINKTKTNTFAFDIRPSLYSDPLTFTINIQANYENTVTNKISRKKEKNIYRPVIK